ncbi:MAG: FG-GAP-like repeat-containing protein [Planctomycetota bacterium]|jgi:uncharacterized protein YjiK
MHRFFLLLLLVEPAAAQAPRSVAEILDDHAGALGPARAVATLRATATVGDRRHAVSGARIQWRLPDACRREIPTGKGQYPWREFFTPGGAFVSKGYFERYRPNQATTRGGYYFLKALAEPFPLLPYVGDAGAQKGLHVGAATVKGKRYEVLYTSPDDHGVRAVYLLDPATHLIENLRYEIEANRGFTNVTFAQYRRVGGVMLPHATYAFFTMLAEDETGMKLVRKTFVREERIAKWEVNPDLADVRFTPPGLARGAAEGFERRVFATGPDPHEVAVGDLDGDGRADLAVACEAAAYVHFGGNEQRPVRVPLGRGHMRGMVIEDFDLDGRLELITTSNVEPAQMLCIVGFDAKRRAEVRTIYGAPHLTYGLLVHDFDRDGIPDVAATGHASRDLQVKFGNGAGGVRIVGTAFPLALKGQSRRGFGLAAGRITGGVLDDIAVADGTRVVIFQGQPNLSFQPRFAIPEQVTPERPWRPVGVAVVDLDRDGLDDLLVVREHPLEDLPGDLVVVRNDGEKLEVTASINAGARVQAVATGHFNADAFPDAVVTSFLTGEVALLLGDGRGGLSKPQRFASGRGTARVAVADCDGDGRDDIVAANRLEDTLALFLSRREAARRARPAPPRAVVCAGPTRAEFALEGLGWPYEFAGEFLLPPEIPDPSGIACLGGDFAHSQFVFVSDKRSALFRGVLDRTGKRFLVGPPVPLRGLEQERLDLEGVAFDRWSGTLFLGCEADSSIVRATVFGQVLGRAPTRIASGGNDGIEGVALRRKKDGTPLLYVFKERNGKTATQPVVHVYGLQEDPFALAPRRTDLTVPLPTPDQSGATVFGDRMFLVCRLWRAIAEIAFDGDAFAAQPRQASYAALAEGLLGLRSPETPLYGNVEGITLDPQGDLFLIVDNNRQVVGRPGRNRGPHGRLLWFRNRAEHQPRFPPQRVKVKQILVPWSGARDARGVKLERTQAAELARRILRAARDGEEFDRLVTNYHYRESRLPSLLAVVAEPLKPREATEYRRRDLPAALGNLIFSLDVGEIGLCEFHPEEAPFGWHIVLRVE